MQRHKAIQPGHAPRVGAVSRAVDGDRQPAHVGARMVAGAVHEHRGPGAHRNALRELEVERDLQPVGRPVHAMFAARAGSPAEDRMMSSPISNPTPHPGQRAGVTDGG